MNKSLLIIVSTLLATSSYASNPDTQSVKPFQVAVLKGNVDDSTIVAKRRVHRTAPASAVLKNQSPMTPKMSNNGVLRNQNPMAAKLLNNGQLRNLSPEARGMLQSGELKNLSPKTLKTLNNAGLENMDKITQINLLKTLNTKSPIRQRMFLQSRGMMDSGSLR